MRLELLQTGGRLIAKANDADYEFSDFRSTTHGVITGDNGRLFLIGEAIFHDIAVRVTQRDLAP